MTSATKFMVTIERVKKTKVNMVWIEKHEPVASKYFISLFECSNGEKIITLEHGSEVKKNDRLVLDEVVYDVKHMIPEKDDRDNFEFDKFMCERNDFETSWKKLELIDGLAKFGQVKVVHKDTEADAFMDSWVGLYIKNILEHHGEMKNGRHIGEIYRMCNHDVPSVVVGAGPSLNKNIELLKRFPGVIICADKAYKTLLANEIEPDIVLSVDCHVDLVADMLTCSRSKNHLLVLNSCSDPKITKIWNGRILWYNMKHPGIQFTDRILPAIFPTFHSLNNVGCVGNSGIVLSDFMSLNPVVLVGQDFGYTGGKMHCTQYEEKDGRFLQINENHEEKLSKRTGKLEVNGVMTYIGFRNYMETTYGLRKNKMINILNCTEGGVLTQLPQIKFSKMIDELEKTSNKKYVEVKEKLRNL